MRNATLILCCITALFSFTANAENSYEPVSWGSDSVATAAVANVWTSPPMYGKIVAFSVGVDSNMSISATTVAGEGLSAGAAKTVFTESHLTNGLGFSTNLVAPIHVWGDRLILGAGLNEDAAALTGFDFLLLLEE